MEGIRQSKKLVIEIIRKRKIKKGKADYKLERIKTVFINLWILLFYKKPKIMSAEETVEAIINNHSSISRFGDGELDMMNRDKRVSLGFQKWDERLQNRLIEIMKSKDKTIIIGLPHVFDRKSLGQMKKESRVWWLKHILLSLSQWYHVIDRKRVYGNASFTRCYIAFKDNANCGIYFEKVKKIWENRDIVIVEGEKSQVGVDNTLFHNAGSVRRILCPSIDAFSSYEKIKEQCVKLPKDTLFLIALGPTATVLAYDLHKLGYQAVDIGHIDIEYEWFLRKADKKIPIKGKYVNEVEEKFEEAAVENDEYKNQIIEKIH